MKYHINLMCYVKSHNINTIVTDERLIRSPELKKQLLKLRVKGIRTYDYVKFYDLLTGRIPVAYQGEDCLYRKNQIENLEYDLFYIQNRSIILDFHILIKTIQTVFFGNGKKRISLNKILT